MTEQSALRETVSVLKMMIATYEKKVTPRCPYKAMRYSLGLAVQCVEKQIPKDIIFNSETDREYEDYICPSCKDILQQRRKGATQIAVYKYGFCPNCGQKLDWSEV